MRAVGDQHEEGEATVYGLIGRLTAVGGQRDPADRDGIWMTEVWDTQASHRDSLTLGPVQEAIRLGKPLIANFSERFETEPVGGVGLS